MSHTVLIMGLGAMGSDIGEYLLGQGIAVSWITRRPVDDPQVLRQFQKIIRAFKRSGVSFPGGFEPCIFHSADSSITPAYVIIECVEETPEAKLEAVRQIKRLLGTNTLLLSTSSAILPNQIHPQCIGMHFFRPVALTTCAEIVVPGNITSSCRDLLTSFIKRCAIHCIWQDDHSAFAANRLLLPLQTEAVRRIVEGYDPQHVNRASQNPLITAGTLSLIDTIGIPVVHSGAASYISRMPPSEQHDYDPLIQVLQSLVAPAQGNKKLLEYDTRSERNSDADQDRISAMAQHLLYVLINTCYIFIENGVINLNDIDFILKNVFQAEATLKSVVALESPAKVAAHLNSSHIQTGISYLKPSSLLF